MKTKLNKKKIFENFKNKYANIYTKDKISFKSNNFDEIKTSFVFKTLKKFFKSKISTNKCY